jgi:tetratricopeptide (TPR) repeat protein
LAALFVAGGLLAYVLGKRSTERIIPMSWLTKWLFRAPTSPYDRGVAHLKQAEYQQAIAAFTEAIRLEPNAPNAYLGRALAYRSVNDEDSAIRDERTANSLGGAEHSTWERLVNRAYQRLKGDLSHADRDEFCRRLDPLQRKAVLLWELNSQVLNGGIPQWVANGYGAQIDEVIAAAREVGSDAAREVAAILEELSRLIATGWEPNAEEEGENGLLSCDDRYYAVQHQFTKDVEQWLESQS